MDWMEQEQERGITITSAATTCRWNDHWINIIDTPGHVDFTIEVERSLRVLDGAIALLDGVAGVEPQTETVWRQADKYAVPRLVFVNKMDRVGADFERCLEMLQERFALPALVVQRPIIVDHQFRGILDLVEMAEYVWNSDDPDEPVEKSPVADERRTDAELHREILLESLANHDDAFLEMVLEGEDPGPERIRALIRKVTLTLDGVPILCGSAFKNKGVKLLLDAVTHYLPSPIDIPPVKGLKIKSKAVTEEVVERAPRDDEPFAALAFKITTDAYVGQLTYIRVYSGTLKAGTVIWNAAKHRRERLGRLLRMHANQREDIDECYAGDIVAVVGAKGVTTGETLCTEGGQLLLENIDFPEPVIRIAIEPKTKADQDKLSGALDRLSLEDPSFNVQVDKDTGQTLIAGMGELHLEVICARLLREFNVGANVGKPQVAYRETVAATAREEGEFIRQSAGKGQYGQCCLKVSPGARGSGFAISVSPGAKHLPQPYLAAICEGAATGYQSGPLAGYPMVDVQAVVVDGSFDEADSTEMAFNIAGAMAYRAACEAAKPVLLEPVMDVEVTVPEEHLGDVIGHVNAKRGEVNHMEARGASHVVKAVVPLSAMFGYATALRSATQGRGTYSMQFAHYAPVSNETRRSIVGN
jgi:elongation factor G